MNISKENISNLNTTMNKSMDTSMDTNIDVELPNNFVKYDSVTQGYIIRYLKQLDSIEKKAYSIGIKHLGSSFNVVKSNGFNTWRSKQV
jgi:hypothetical protein